MKIVAISALFLLTSFTGLSASQQKARLYPTALKTGRNLLSEASWRMPSSKHAPHAVATMGRGGPFNADAPTMKLVNERPEFAYWSTLVPGIRTGRTYFFGTWTKIKAANLLCWAHGISTVNGKDMGFRVYCFSGCNPALERYFDDDVKRRLSGDPNQWRLIARTFSPSEAFVGGLMSVEVGFFKSPGDIVFAEPFLIDITDEPKTLEVELKGSKPVKKLEVIRTGTNDREWLKEFPEPVTDFSETLPSRTEAFEGMGEDPMFGRALIVYYADGTEERVSCPADGLFQRR